MPGWAWRQSGNLLFIAVVYFIFCYAFTTLSRWLEKRLACSKAI
ncbi:MAG TPA: hypothetical protein VIS30_01050 [Candidatus Deferrimicrobiaceae bacterium]